MTNISFNMNNLFIDFVLRSINKLINFIFHKFSKVNQENGSFIVFYDNLKKYF
jgi:hypothetical protein